MTGMPAEKDNLEARQCDLDDSIGPDHPRPLATVLGEDAIRDTVAPFVDYMETAVSVHEHSGDRGSRLMTGNSYCELLVGSGDACEEKPPDGTAASLCDQARGEVARAAIATAAPEERGCFAGMTLRAVPIRAEGGIVGAVVGAVSEVPSDEKTVMRVAEDAGIDLHCLWQATGQSFHKPDYLYQAARSHLERLADTLGRFYEHSLERERSVNEIVRRESTLEETNSFLQGLLDGMAEGVCTTDNRGFITYANPAACETLGYTSSELRKMHAFDVIDPQEVEIVKQMMQHRLEGNVDQCELEIIRKDGTRKTVVQKVAPLRKGDEIVGRIAVINDITERHRMEADLMERNRRLTLLQSFTARGIARIAGGEIDDGLAREVVETMGYEYCSIFMLSEDGKRLNIVARNERLGEDLDALNKSGLHDLANPGFRQAPVAQAFLTGEHVVVEDISKFEGFDRVHEVARILGSRSLAALPLIVRGQKLGSMVVHTKELHSFTGSELEFLRAVADQVSSIAGNAPIYRTLERSRERYRELYDSAADWMYSLSEDGDILDCNQTMIDALGYAKSGIVGHRIFEFETEEDSHRARRDLKKTRVNGVFAAERHFITQAGDGVIVDLRARMVEDEEGRRWWEVIGRDITVKKETENRINLLVAAVENTRDGVVVSDLNGDILSINEAGAALYGYSRDELIGMHMGDVWSARNADELKEEIYHASLTKGSWEGQMWIRHRTGADVPVFASSAVVNGEGGKPIALVGIVRDISEGQRMTEEILRRNRELAVMNAVAAATAGSRDVPEMLERTLNVVIKTMSYDGGIVFLTERTGNFLKPAAMTFPIPERMREQVEMLPVGKGHSGAIAATGKAVFVEDYMNSGYRIADMPNSVPVSSLGGVPLRSQEKVLGVLVVSTAARHEFSEHERALLQAVGNSIGVALENARLFDDIARAKTQWESTFDAMTNGVSIHDRDYRIIRANKALATMLGTTTEELIGKKCYEVFHGLDAPSGECPLTQTIRTGNHASVSIHEPYLNRTLSLSADPYFDDQGNIIGCIHDIRDITEQEEMRRQLTQSEKLRALGEMAGGVAHDFNNFLTVILGNTQLLLANHYLDHDTVNALETIQRASADAAETVRRIQEFTRVRTVRSFTTVDVNQAVANAIEVSRPRWRDEAESRGARIEMQVELDRALPPVNGNASEMGEVFMNLILNAADALQSGGRIRVTTGVTRDGMVEITIADDGKGMIEEVRQRVFEPFYSTKGPQGSGLGLSLAYGIVSRHGGDISVESREGEGSTFRVLLPIAAVSDLHVAPDDIAGMPPELAAADAGIRTEMDALRSVGATPGRVLVIDDEGMIRTLLADILEQMGQEVETANAGIEGVRRFRDALAGAQAGAEGHASSGERLRPFDLVLTDLGMPEMSGWEVVESIKALSPRTPVALITGWGDQLDPKKMEASGVDMVMAKPFSVREVKRLVAEALAGKE